MTYNVNIEIFVLNYLQDISIKNKIKKDIGIRLDDFSS